MSDYNGNCGLGGIGEIIVLMLFFAMANNGNGGLFGNNNNTAAETAALVQQDNLRQLAGQTNSTLGWNTQLTGGLVQAAERIGDKVDRNLANTQQQFGRLDTNLCQVTNNLTQQINGLQTNMDARFCATNQHIDCVKDQIIGYMTQKEIESLRQQLQDTKGLLAVQQANCDRDSNTRTLLEAIHGISHNNCGGGCNGGNFYNGGNGIGCVNGYQQAVLTNLAQQTAALATIAQTQQAQGNTLAAIQTRVNQIPTTAAAA